MSCAIVGGWIEDGRYQINTTIGRGGRCRRRFWTGVELRLPQKMKASRAVTSLVCPNNPRQPQAEDRAESGGYRGERYRVPRPRRDCNISSADPTNDQPNAERGANK